jgi:hypothetical protein
MKNRNKLIMGTAFALATIAVAIDHTQHRLPDPVQSEYEGVTILEDGEEESSSPCSMDSGGSPCSM